jgi:hypothetical protein
MSETTHGRERLRLRAVAYTERTEAGIRIITLGRLRRIAVAVHAIPLKHPAFDEVPRSLLSEFARLLFGAIAPFRTSGETPIAETIFPGKSRIDL